MRRMSPSAAIHQRTRLQGEVAEVSSEALLAEPVGKIDRRITRLLCRRGFRVDVRQVGKNCASLFFRGSITRWFGQRRL